MYAGGIEILLTRYAKGMGPVMQALIDTAPEGSYATPRYHGKRRLLMLYGAGNPERQAIVKRHLATPGNHALCWDLSYWDRKQRLRVAIDGTQPSHADILSSPCGGRTYPEPRDDYDPNGHVLIIGLGRKTRVQYGLAGPQWELEALERAKAQFPLERIRFRPKGGRLEPLMQCATDDSPSIEAALKGAALVICRHSNVAIDACVANIPVWCEDGAAHCLYRSTTQPTVEQRKGLLKRVAWWQWADFEARAAWDFLLPRVAV